MVWSATPKPVVSFAILEKRSYASWSSRCSCRYMRQRGSAGGFAGAGGSCNLKSFLSIIIASNNTQTKFKQNTCVKTLQSRLLP